MTPAPVRTVFIVLQKADPPAPTDLKGIFANLQPQITVEGVYENELDAARVAGSTSGTWYISRPIIPWTT